MTGTASTDRALDSQEIASFVRDGFVKIERAFPPEVAEQARVILWRDTGCDPDDPGTWTKPVIRLGYYGQPPFRAAATAPALRNACDQLVGAGRWLPCVNVGTFPVRFPSTADPGDTGWHVDTSFAREGDDPHDFMSWRVNIASRGRALLQLLLFSDVGIDDAPTRIRVGSHLDIARILAPAGEDGLSLRELAADGFSETAGRHEVVATGEAGTVYLCHPFLVHAAQRHRGTRPRFMAQPPLLPASSPAPLSRDGECSPVERAVRNALR